MDHSWMDRRVVDGVISAKYKEGAEYFCDFIFKNVALLHQGWIHCPCNRCDNREIFDRDIISVHLYKSRFMPNYKH